MTRYVFKLSKNCIASQSDSNIDLKDDSTVQPDVTCYLYLDDNLVFFNTVTDTGGHLEYTTDLDPGNHSFIIKTSPGAPTDVHVDLFLIDDQCAIPTQYDLQNVIDGTQSLGKHKLCFPVKTNKDTEYIWYGEVHWGDQTINTDFYRPHLVADLSQYWKFNFHIADSKIISFTHTPDTSDVLYDSTENYQYYFTHNTASAWNFQSDWDNLIQILKDGYTDYLIEGSDSSTTLVWQWYTSVSTSASWTTGIWKGAGTYYVNDLIYVDSNTDESTIDNDKIVITTYENYIWCVAYIWYYSQYTVSAITVS